MAIRERRDGIGLSQARLALVAGVAMGTIRNAEAGKPLEEDTREKIEGVLGWWPGTVDPLLSHSTMAALAEALLLLGEQNLPYRRRILHTLIGDLAQGVISDNTLASAPEALFQYMTATAAEQLADEIRAIMSPSAPVPEVGAFARSILAALDSGEGV